MALSFGFYFEVRKTEWIALVCIIGLVFVAEIINTPIVQVVDLVTSAHHPLAKNAKNLDAAAVLLAYFIAVVVGAIIFAPYLF